MVTIDAEFDGSRVILPQHLRGRGPGRVTVSFPDDLIEVDETARTSMWDVINRAVPSGRTVDDVNKQLDEDQGGPDAWDHARGSA